MVIVKEKKKEKPEQNKLPELISLHHEYIWGA